MEYKAIKVEKITETSNGAYANQLCSEGWVILAVSVVDKAEDGEPKKEEFVYSLAKPLATE